jgi:hypothetical protein
LTELTAARGTGFSGRQVVVLKHGRSTERPFFVMRNSRHLDAILDPNYLTNLFAIALECVQSVQVTEKKLFLQTTSESCTGFSTKLLINESHGL